MDVEKKSPVVEEEDAQRSNTPSDSPSSDSSSFSGSQQSSRENTPGPMPKFRYDKRELLEIKKKPLSKRRPGCLSPVHLNKDGLWDPDLWLKSFDEIRGASPNSVAAKERKPLHESDQEAVFKRKPSAVDAKARIKEEEEEGIVLSPQRRSFGTGCHVSILPRRRRSSPPDTERDGQQNARDHRKNGKIGSGRIQISHERHDREYHDTRPRYDREREDHRPMDRPNPLDRFRRDDRGTCDTRDTRLRDREKEHERDAERDQNAERERDRFGERNSRERNYDRDRGFRQREYGRDERYSNSRGMRYHHNDEPEWFTSGPASQSDTIELHGFEGPAKEENKERPRGNSQEKSKEPSKEKTQPPKARPKSSTISQARVQAEKPKEEREKVPREDRQDEDRPSSASGSVSVPDRNGSLETNESSSPEGSPHHNQPDGTTAQPNSNAPDFDFNEFFKIENIPGLPDHIPVEQESVATGSRFSQWFQGGSHQSSHTNSRRSSINDEFGYLNDLLNLSGGQKSPVIPSPPLIDHHHSNMYYQDHQDAKRDAPEPHQSLLEILHNATRQGGNMSKIPDDLVIHNVPQKPLAASEVEKNLKAILMRGSESGAPGKGLTAQKAYMTQQPPQAPIVGKVMTAAELEAKLIGEKKKESTQTRFKNNVAPSRNVPGAFPPHANMYNPSTVLPPSGNVTTVSELEAGLKHLGLNKDAQAAAAITAANKQALSDQRHSKEQRQKSPVTPADMGAFNKLLGMMKASGVLHETPKMPNKHDGNPLSPIKLLPNMLPNEVAAQQQKDYLQKLIQQQQVKLLQEQQQNKMKQQLQAQNMQQQQAQNMQQQQIQHQKHVQDQILKFMKQNPGLIPKTGPTTSPISPSVTLQPPPSPRCPSPSIPQQSLLQPQPSPSPRAPSPIMFGSQPPMHLTAPSPIHPTQLPQSSQTLSPNTLQVNQRVPSPQELIVHAQAIMQNALLKKQLEDQKERFLKKQIDRTKSPIPSSAGMNQTLTSTPTQLTPAFTPTSVIRRMVTDKAEKPKDNDEQVEDRNSPRNYDYRGQQVDTPPIMTVASDGSINISVPVTTITPSSNHSMMSDTSSHNLSMSSSQRDLSAQSQQLAMQGLLNASGTYSHHIQSSQGSPAKQARPLIGSGMMNFQHLQHSQSLTQQAQTLAQAHFSQVQSFAQAQSLAQTNLVSMAQGQMPPGRPIVKGSGQMLMSPPGQPRAVTGGMSMLDNIMSSQRPITGNQHNIQTSQSQKTPPQLAVKAGAQSPSPNMPRTSVAQYGVQMGGRMPIPTNMVRPGSVGISPPTSNQLLMQRMMHPNVSLPNAGRGMSPHMLNQLSPLSALQAAQVQRNMDARYQTGHNMYPGGIPPLITANNTPRGTFPVSGIGRSVSPQMGQPVYPYSKQDGRQGPVSPGFLQHAGLNALLGVHGTVDNNLAKWFNSDVLKQQNSPMPPLPSQGQKVMTVDEIERRQQMVTN